MDNKMIMNKRLLVVVWSVLISLNISSQEDISEYYPVGTTWQEAYVRIYDSKLNTQFCVNTVVGDTIINDISYKWVNVDVYDTSTGMKVTESAIKGYAIREKGDSVFGRNVADEEVLRYVFGKWEIGDKVNCFQDTIARVSYIELLDGKKYACIDSFPNYQNVSKEYQPKMVINTIGSITHGLLKEKPGPRGGLIYSLISFTRGNVTLYRNEHYWLTSILNATKNYMRQSDSTYSLKGVRMNEKTPLPRGIYIRNGKKFISR